MKEIPTGLLAEAASRPPDRYLEVSVRELLRQWGYHHRSFESVATIERDLGQAGLHAEPRFGPAPSSGTVLLVPDEPRAAADDEGDPGAHKEDPGSPHAEDPDADESTAGEDSGSPPFEEEFPQATLRVGHLGTATGGVASVSPSDSLETAQGRMLLHKYSQLAVLSDARNLRGAVSWESIAQARIAGHASMTLAGVLDAHPEVLHTADDLIEKIPAILKTGFAFTRDTDYNVCGIVTTADLSQQFDNLARPFLLIGEIEYRLRSRVDQHLTADEIRAPKQMRKATCAGDLTLGNVWHLLSEPSRWVMLHWRIDQDLFLAELWKVRDIRNKVMHFDAKPLDDGQLTTLQSFLGLLRQLDPKQ